MVFIPFVYFLLVFLYIKKKNGLDLSAVMALIYAISSFFSIYLYFQNQTFGLGVKFSEFNLGLLPTVLYCFLNSICIIPFYKYNTNIYRNLIVVKKVWLFDWIVNIYFIVFILLLLLYAKDLAFRFLFGDLGEIRTMAYQGDLTYASDNYTGILRKIITILEVLGEGSYFMILFFFYSICALQKSIRYNVKIIISSFSALVMGFLTVDRSTTIFWMALFIGSLFLFKPFLKKSSYFKFLKRLIFIVFLILGIYIFAVTISRFGDRDYGASGSVISYLGQPYLYFCELWSGLPGDRFFTNRVFPLLTNFFGTANVNILDVVVDMRDIYGMNINIFSSFVGVFLIDLGHFGAVSLPIFLSILLWLAIGQFYKRKYVSLSLMIVLFAFATILLCGIITYFYSSINRSFCLIFFLFISFIFSHKLKT